MLAAAPAWFADNVAVIALITLIVVTVLVLRFIEETMTRALAVAVIALLAFLVYVNRDELGRCARTCECRLANQHITVPTCQPGLDL